MRTAEHMEHRNLERKWRPSFALGPHLTEGRSNDERRRICDVVVVARVSGLAASSYRRISDVWVPRGFIARDASNTNRGLRERRFFFGCKASRRTPNPSGTETRS
jgi:hypothetical protein